MSKQRQQGKRMTTVTNSAPFLSDSTKNAGDIKITQLNSIGDSESSSSITSRNCQSSLGRTSNLEKIHPNRKFLNGIFMILSPAKTLDLTPMEKSSEKTNAMAYTIPNCCPEKTRLIAQSMKNRSESELAQLLAMSKNLAATAKQYWDQFDIEYYNKYNDKVDTIWLNNQTYKPCIHAFSGPAYQGINVKDMALPALEYMNEYLTIIDPLYGLLRPFDLIQPYRLEMASKNVILESSLPHKTNKKATSTKLHDYWSDVVTSSLVNNIKKNADIRDRSKSDKNSKNTSFCNILLNLASDELSAAVNESKLSGVQYVKIVFWENGRVVSVHAKRARGLMVRYVCEKRCTSLEELKLFNYEGYQYVPESSSIPSTFPSSKSDNNDVNVHATLVYDRPKQSKEGTATCKSTAKKVKSSTSEEHSMKNDDENDAGVSRKRSKATLRDGNEKRKMTKKTKSV